MNAGQATEGAKQAGDALAAWRAVRADPAIQFAPIKYNPPPPRENPEWLQALIKWLESLFKPVGEALGMSWPVMWKVLLGLAVVLLLAVLWRWLAPLMGRKGVDKAEAMPEWAPNREAALALLEDADRLASAGHYDEAAHLLLQRSVRQIADARPDWLAPSSTAREIALLPGLGPRARGAFALIAGRVERGFYALIPLDAEDWSAARDAYAEFALAEISA